MNLQMADLGKEYIIQRIETDEEWEMVNEVLAAFQEDEESEAEFDCE